MVLFLYRNEDINFNVTEIMWKVPFQNKKKMVELFLANKIIA